MANVINPQVLQFFTNYYPQDDYFSWASNKAYLDMNRTMRFKEKTEGVKGDELKRILKIRNGWKREGTEIIKKSFQKGLKGKGFDEWHKLVCEELIKIYDHGQLINDKNSNKLTFGQAQKWLNMTLKYLWLLGKLGMLAASDQSIIDSVENDLHVPLDSYILRYVAGMNGKDGRAPTNGLSKEIKWKNVKKPIFQEWSKIDDAGYYYDYQKELKKAMNGIIPIEWELRSWHDALKTYGEE